MKLRTMTAIAAFTAVLAGCGEGGATDSGEASEQPDSTAGATDTSDAGADEIRVALVGNQAFGDEGPMDDMADGLERCAADFGYQTTQIESLTTLEQEEDVRALAQEGYELIFTTFPAMTPATTTVASEYPDTKFAAVYQFINMGETVAPNVWDTEYKAEGTNYVFGVVAATLSETGKLGYVAGEEDPTINAGINAFIQGARATNPDVEIEVAFADSWEDIAKGKEIGLAMASRGIDFIQTAAAKTQLGVLEATKETGILFSGDVGDNREMYPEGFVGYLGSTFGQNIYLGCQHLAEDTFPGGEHTFMDLSNGGYFVPFDAIEAWAGVSDHPGAAEIPALAEEVLDAVVSGEVEVATNSDTPQP